MTENYWESINEYLSPFDGRWIPAGTSFKNRPIIILAPPRGGSTLLQQVLLSTGRFGYVSNLMARFWQAPIFGAHLQKTFLDPDFVSSFESRYGNTTGPFEPHEWGWFWQLWLRLSGDAHYQDGEVDWARLGQVLTGIEGVLEAPLIFDNGFLCANLSRIYDEIGPLLILNLSRLPWFVCNSLVNARIERYGDIGRFYGARPRRMDLIDRLTDPVEKCVLQARLLADETEAHLVHIPSAQVHDITYEDLHKAPMECAASVRAFLRRHGAGIEVKASEIAPFEDRNRNARSAAGLRGDIDRHVRAYFPEAVVPD